MLTVWVSVTVIAVLCRPLGSLLPEGVEQPVVTVAVAVNVAVAVSAPPRPETSARQRSWLSPTVAHRIGC